MPNKNIDIKTINSDVELSQFTLQPVEPVYREETFSGSDEPITVGQEVGSSNATTTTPSSSSRLVSKRHLPRVKILGTGGTIASKGGKASDTAAVSYTHLDVYKRQVLWYCWIELMTLSKWCSLPVTKQFNVFKFL